jgi:hypothetical protein
MFWDKKEENLITLLTDDSGEDIKNITINAYSKKLGKTIEKVATSSELFRKDRVRRSYILQHLDILKGIYLY